MKKLTSVTIGKRKMSKADRYTIKSKQQEFYSDFMTNFDLNPITGILATVTDIDSINQSLRNLVLTQRTERYYNSSIGTRTNALMFDLMDSMTENSLKSEFEFAIKNNEPRVIIRDIQVKADIDNNLYRVAIIYSPINNTSNHIQLDLVLKRVR